MEAWDVCLLSLGGFLIGFLAGLALQKSQVSCIVDHLALICGENKQAVEVLKVMQTQLKNGDRIIATPPPSTLWQLQSKLTEHDRVLTIQGREDVIAKR